MPPDGWSLERSSLFVEDELAARIGRAEGVNEVGYLPDGGPDLLWAEGRQRVYERCVDDALARSVARIQC